MADLIAIGYPDETTAFEVADEARRLAADLIIRPDAIAVISRNTDGSYHVTTSHHPMTKRAKRTRSRASGPAGNGRFSWFGTPRRGWRSGELLREHE